jgi:hypothetical protein
VKFQSKSVEPLGQDLFYPLGVWFLLKTDDEVVGPAENEAFSFQSGAHFHGNPVIKYVVEEDVAEQG